MLVTIGLAAQILGLVSTGAALAPEIITAADTIKGLLTSGVDPSPEVEMSIRAALDVSEANVQAAQPGDVS